MLSVILTSIILLHKYINTFMHIYYYYTQHTNETKYRLHLVYLSISPSTLMFSYSNQSLSPCLSPSHCSSTIMSTIINAQSSDWTNWIEAIHKKQWMNDQLLYKSMWQCTHTHTNTQLIFWECSMVEPNKLMDFLLSH